MRFLDLDLDFFLNENAYYAGSDSTRLGSEYRPWTDLKVRRFLEKRCGLSHNAPVPGRTIESHDKVISFWRTLIQSGDLRVPFELIHVDAHPDLWAGDGLCLISEFLYIDSERVLEVFKKKHVHPGNYLTFAVASGWIASLAWVHLRKQSKGLPQWDADARSISQQFEEKKGEDLTQALPAADMKYRIPFKILPWYKFSAGGKFDYITLSRSPTFTPPGSDELIPIIEGYMRQI